MRRRIIEVMVLIRVKRARRLIGNSAADGVIAGSSGSTLVGVIPPAPAARRALTFSIDCLSGITKMHL